MYINIHSFDFPDWKILQKSLAKLFLQQRVASLNKWEVVSRLPFTQSSTYPAEIINIRLNNELVSLFLKYSSGTRYENDSRNGIAYEARVYREVVQHLPLSKAAFYGTCKLNGSSETLLVLNYLAGSESLEYKRGVENFKNAAGWLSQFHQYGANSQPSFLKVYDLNYFRWWSEKALQYWIPSGQYPWLRAMAEYYNTNCHLLVETEQTIIHGEFFPSNLLIHQNNICPVDWESAAIACGEIDLACLVEAENKADVRTIIEKYISGRWPSANAVPSFFSERFKMAQAYLQFRYLLPKKKKKKTDMRERRFARLYELGKEAGIF